MNSNQKEEFRYQFAGMAMQGMISNHVCMENLAKKDISIGPFIAYQAALYADNLINELERVRKGYELIFFDAKTLRPEHLQRCLCWDSFEKGYRCYVYDDISKYWCTQETTEHDPNGDNHVSDYADNRITHWSHLPKEGGEK